MQPLDLTVRPPRSPKEQLDGLVMMPRTIDKIRAFLPGGNPGVYKIDGVSKRLLDRLGVSEEDLRQAVARAQSDDDVAAWLRTQTDPSRYAEVSKAISERSLDHIEDKAAFAERYPVVKERPELHYLSDILEADDAQMFSAEHKH